MEVMSMRTVEQVSEWDSVPFDGGYDGLRALADREFSGAVVSGSTQLFMLNGRTVGILDGDLDTFENADGTARQAPHDALPLLAVMQARADEPRAQYYTEDTPISEVDRTLTDGKFTGYVELSENVLSGDYYLVYHQGRSMSVAWVGSAQRLATDEDAFEQADGEVGIYQVIPADIEPIELPEPELDDSPAGAAFEDEASATDAPEAGAEGTDTTSAATPDEHEATADADDEFTEPALERSAGTGDTDGSAEEGNDRGSAAAPSGPPGSKAAGASQGRAVDPGQSVSERSTSEAEEQSVERAETTTEPDRETSAEQNHERRAEAQTPRARYPKRSSPTLTGLPRSQLRRISANRSRLGPTRHRQNPPAHNLSLRPPTRTALTSTTPVELPTNPTVRTHRRRNHARSRRGRPPVVRARRRRQRSKPGRFPRSTPVGRVRIPTRRRPTRPSRRDNPDKR